MSIVNPVRILYLNHTGQVSGAERVLLNMLRGLDRKRYELAVACPQGRLAEMVVAEDVSHINIPAVQARFNAQPGVFWRAAGSIAKAVLAVRRGIDQWQPEIVHANTVRAGIVASLATVGKRVKVIWHVHDTLPRHPFSRVIRLLAYLSRKTHFIAVSDAVAVAFQGTFRFAGRVVTLYNGTDLSRFPAKDRYSREFRSTIKVPRHAFMVCAVGQICARKGLVDLVTAFGQIQTMAPEMHLVIAGSVVFEHERRYFETLQAVARDPKLEGRVHLVGEIHNVSALLQASDLLVLNSTDEPFGLVLVEAMSSGTPVLATRTGGVPEIIRDGRDGWLVEPGDTRALAQRLLQLSHNQMLLDQAAATALSEACPRFSLERFHVRLQGLYERLVPQRQARTYEQSQPAVARR